LVPSRGAFLIHLRGEHHIIEGFDTLLIYVYPPPDKLLSLAHLAEWIKPTAFSLTVSWRQNGRDTIPIIANRFIWAR